MQEIDLFVVHWNQPVACCASIEALRGQQVPLRITIIDNNSDPHLLRELEANLSQDITLVKLTENRGWGGAINVVLRQWLKHATSPYCLISAHDAMPRPGCLATLLSATAVDSRIGIACPQYPEPVITRFSRWHGVYPETVEPGPFGVAQEMDAPHGTLMLLQRKCIAEIGLFDERYFAYGDEHELGARSVRKGWKVVIVWGAIVTNPATSIESTWRSYLFARNSLLLVDEYFGRGAATLRALLILANTWRLSIKPPGNDFPFSAAARRKAVRDYFFGQSGRPVLP